VSNIPFYGLAVCCTDHPEVQALGGPGDGPAVVTFGFNAQADVRAVNLTYQWGRAFRRSSAERRRAVIEGCTLPMPGDHNVSQRAGGDGGGAASGDEADEIREAGRVRRGEPPLYQGG
jgi:UDP-N-acetylmuramate--alanine ligase